MDADEAIRVLEQYLTSARFAATLLDDGKSVTHPVDPNDGVPALDLAIAALRERPLMEAKARCFDAERAWGLARVAIGQGHKKNDDAEQNAVDDALRALHRIEWKVWP